MNFQKMIDVEGACARSEIGWNMAWIEEKDGSRESYGYIDMFLGHDSVAMIYSETMMEWVELGRGFWDPPTGAFNFKNRYGICRY
jgi:hypothetical protein